MDRKDFVSKFTEVYASGFMRYYSIEIILFFCLIVSARHYMKQIISGMLYLHSHNILHRDLTLANLLLTKDMKVVGFLYLFC